MPPRYTGTTIGAKRCAIVPLLLPAPTRLPLPVVEDELEIAARDGCDHEQREQYENCGETRLPLEHCVPPNSVYFRTSAILARGPRGGITHTGEPGLPRKRRLQAGFGDRATAPGEAALVPAADGRQGDAVTGGIDQPPV